MAGPYYPTMYFTSARTGLPFMVGMHFAGSDAAGAYIELNLNTPAVATSPKYVVIPEDCYLTDFVLAASDHPATGIVELISNSRNTGIMVNLANHAIANTGRPKLQVPLSKGTELRLVVRTACEA